MTAKCCLFLLILGLTLPASALPAVLKIPKPQSDSLVAQDYYKQLLRLALISGAAGRPVPELLETTSMEQGRASHELNRGTLVDVYWMGTNIEREQQLRAIRIPLDRGLLGYRRFIIRSDRQFIFDAITRYDQLKKYLGCQGLDWPDVDIMRAADLRVTEVPVFEGLYQQVVAKRCDYFPRGYFEAEPELMQRKKTYPNLMRYDSLVLHYPFTVYFFVNRDNEELARWIEQGLEKMIDEGALLKYMVGHPLTAHVFPLDKKKPPKYTIHIANPYLPADTDFTDTRYWFQPSDFVSPTDFTATGDGS